MSEPVYTVERCCGRETVDTMEVTGIPAGQPFQACVQAVRGYQMHVVVNPDEDYFRVIDPAGATWLWQLRDGKVVRLLRPPRVDSGQP